jgi:signal transduction histidine kinase
LVPLGYRLPIGEAMAGKVAQTREPMIIDDYSKWANRLSLYDGIDLTAVIEVPMLYRGELIGVLCIEEFGEGAKKFTEDDMRLLTIFAGQAAGAVQSARMFQDIQISNETKDKFFSIIAHDLRSPYHGMLGLADILIDDVDSFNKEEMNDHLGKLKMALTQQYELLSDLLEWARLQMGSFVTKPETISLNNVVDNVIGSLTLLAQQKKISLQNLIASSIKVFADKVLLGIVMRNLISNGVKFTKESGSIIITAGNKESFVEITVQDTGVGISKEVKDQIFRIDTHYSTDGTAREKGTGLGLILCKEIIEKSGGNIRVESEPGKGSKFIFTLPAEG